MTDAERPEELRRERLAAFATEDFLVLDLVHPEQPVPSSRSRLGPAGAGSWG